ncbi:CPBP family intramembrane glutamic endopeptidase [Halomicronema sp. CCY15110]|uniref:CPBP family intramembrane glutamic endopeptidase n=1 Tax=Halomicronema sp. CCY15110 TaxID=2767773 RepID=UPI001951C909|nr:type II CAAX endopeptidase family protein [Halomicronema sp. CCY15110]
MFKSSPRLAAFIALVLVVGAANLGIVARLYGQGAGGQALFVATRVWILVLPLLWVWRIDRQSLSLGWPTRQEWWVGGWLGLAMFGVIYGAYVLLGQRWIDVEVTRSQATAVGLLNPWIFAAFAIYFTFVNALVEEYIWRWFVYRKCEVLVPGGGAVALAALCFTLHHVVSLFGFTENWVVTSLGSIGVFVAGATWSACYLRYQSLWACYISHAWADLAIAIVAWQILFT